MAGFDRIDRISAEVARELDRILRDEVHDPRLSGTWSIPVSYTHLVADGHFGKGLAVRRLILGVGLPIEAEPLCVRQGDGIALFLSLIHI